MPAVLSQVSGSMARNDLTRLALAIALGTLSVGPLACHDIGDPTGTGVVLRPHHTSESDASDDASTDASNEVAEAEAGSSDASEESAAEAGETDVTIEPIPDPPAMAPLAAKSPECRACAVANCLNYVNGCSTVTGEADGGPEAGTRNSALCLDALTCVVESGCAQQNASTCYCGTKSPDDCIDRPRADGECKGVLEASFGTTEAGEIVSSFYLPSTGGGWATLVVQCLKDNRCASCFPPPPEAGPDADPDAEDCSSRAAVRRQSVTQPTRTSR